ncbi:hypothetical protein C7449_10318 [Mycoplana dimorpha]|uniref:Uncharacterized protein n=1 Tax=Mycoplana dimorpha TaxID=28320 RepID=A0A2T5BAJ9_MYCDI|nr:hypothetical protein C7449_10318 [Mycoplana dimorpha]
MTLKARDIPCPDVKDRPRRPQPHYGKEAPMQKKEAVL